MAIFSVNAWSWSGSKPSIESSTKLRIDITQHQMDAEFYDVNQETVDIINTAKEEGRRVIAVGTTALNPPKHVTLAELRPRVC